MNHPTHPIFIPMHTEAYLPLEILIASYILLNVIYCILYLIKLISFFLKKKEVSLFSYLFVEDEWANPLSQFFIFTNGLALFFYLTIKIANFL